MAKMPRQALGDALRTRKLSRRIACPRQGGGKHGKEHGELHRHRIKPRIFAIWIDTRASCPARAWRDDRDAYSPSDVTRGEQRLDDQRGRIEFET
jgi:hypothetical protein